MGKIEEQARAKIDYALKIGTSREYINTMWELLEQINIIALGYRKSSLPTQQDKVVVPQVVDEFIKCGNKEQQIAFLVSKKYSILTCDMAESELKQWLREISMDDLLSLTNGYTVEKEQLYYIELPLEGKTVRYCEQFLDDPKSSFFSSSYTPKKLTEKEIEAIGECYLSFAVPVEEEAE